MRREELDVALLPVIELADLPGLEIVPGLGIVTSGPARSVLLVSRARRKARRALGSQTMRTRNSKGTTESVMAPSRASRLSSTTMMPNSSTRSPIAKIEDSRNSCTA